MSLKINNDTANGSATLQPSNTATGDVTHTLPAFTTELAPRMQLMTAKTASGTSVDFDGIPAWAKKITVMFANVSTNGTSTPRILLGAGSIQTTAYQSNSNNMATGSTNAILNSTSGFDLYAGFATDSIIGSIIFTNITGNTWVSNGLLSVLTTTQVNSTGSVILSGTLDRVRITTANGTDLFDAGLINILVEG